jgi:1,4-dihydroxy-2-naphthoate octaprenyltransferase
MRKLAPFIVMIAILVVIAFIVVVITNYHLKKKALDKGPVDSNTIRIFESLHSYGAEMLKWGFVLLFGGAGLVLLEFLPYDENSPLPYGVESICIALGFLTYHSFISRRK